MKNTLKLPLILALFLAFPLTVCSSSKPTSPTASVTRAEPTKPQPKAETPKKRGTPPYWYRVPTGMTVTFSQY